MRLSAQSWGVKPHNEKALAMFGKALEDSRMAERRLIATTCATISDTAKMRMSIRQVQRENDIGTYTYHQMNIGWESETP